MTPRYIIAKQGTYHARATELANFLKLIVRDSAIGLPAGEWYLAIDHSGASLSQAGKSAAHGVQSAFHQALPVARAGNNDLLLKAIGFPKAASYTIVDATAGLGGDAAVIATRAQSLLLIERSPVIAELLREGLQGQESTGQISLHVGNAIEVLGELAVETRPEVIYLDPMFHFSSAAKGTARAKKSALPKKSAQLLQAVVGVDADQADLLAAALAVASRRVVVKRPRTALAIDGPAASFSVSGKQLRYDVYLKG